jgi:hypothetical protein
MERAMKTFVDAAGRTWTIALNLGTAMTVKDRLGVDLLRPEDGDPPLLTRLGTDELLLGEILCALLEGQFDAHKVTVEDVRAAFDGAALLAAQTAFYEELISFFRSRGRQDRAMAVEKQMALINAAVKAVEMRIEGLDIDETIRGAIRGAISGALPEASASTPGR